MLSGIEIFKFFVSYHLNFTTQDFNRLMQLRPFYFDIQINVSP